MKASFKDNVHIRTIFCIAVTAIQAIAITHLDFEPPDAALSDKGGYKEAGKNYGKVTVKHQGAYTIKFAGNARAGKQCLSLEIPGNKSASKDSKNFVRQEWVFAKWEHGVDNWVGYSVKFDAKYEVPAWYGTILNQVRSPGLIYGFDAGIYINKGSADGPIPMAYRYMQGRSKSDADFDSGVRKAGFLFERGKWYDIVVNWKFKKGGSGLYYKVWVNGKQVVNLTGLKNVGSDQTGDFRVGQYGRVERGTRHIYIDELRAIGKSMNEVDPAQSGGAVALRYAPAAEQQRISSLRSFGIGGNAGALFSINGRKIQGATKENCAAGKFFYSGNLNRREAVIIR